MQPTNKNNRRKIVWVAVLTSMALALSINSAYSRLIDWTSAELVYVPSDLTPYSSDCLVAGGQQILLSDWQIDETERIVTIAVRRPAPTETSNPTEIPQKGTLPTVPETQIPETSEDVTAESTEVTEPGSTGETAPEMTEATTPDNTDATMQETTGATDATAPEGTEEETEPITEATTPDPTEGDAVVVDLEPTDQTTTPTEETTAEPTQEATEPSTDPATEPTEESITSTEVTEESTASTDATEDSTGVTEESSEATEDTTGNTEESTSESTDETIPEETWDQTEVTVTMDETAQEHLTCEVQVGGDSIQLLLKRNENAPGLQQTAQATVHVQWQGLEGTLYFNILPYGATTVEDTEPETEPQASVVPSLEQVSASSIMDPERMVTCVRLNLETMADFTLSFLKGNEEMSMVRWSLDGVSYSMLYDSNRLTISYPYQPGWDGIVFLDFSLALEENQLPSITVEASGYDPVVINPVLQPLPEILQSVIKTVQLPWTMEMATQWGDAQMVLQPIQRLTVDEEGNLIYADDSSLIATITEEGILLELTQEEIYPTSGSYRMIVQWIWNETAIEEQIIYFFINTN